MKHFRNIFMSLGILFSVGVDAICEEMFEALDDSLELSWNDNFKLVQIPSGIDGHVQMAYLYGSKALDPAPLIVSLHTWSSDYTQQDPNFTIMLSFEFVQLRISFAYLFPRI